MIVSTIDRDRLCAAIEHTPTVKEINALVAYAHDTPAHIRIIDLTVPRAFQENSPAMDLLRKDWKPIGNCKFLLNIKPDSLHIHEDERIRHMRSGLN
jgi:hypothetical protein